MIMIVIFVLHVSFSRLWSVSPGAQVTGLSSLCLLVLFCLLQPPPETATAKLRAIELYLQAFYVRPLLSLKSSYCYFILDSMVLRRWLSAPWDYVRSFTSAIRTANKSMRNNNKYMILLGIVGKTNWPSWKPRALSALRTSFTQTLGPGTFIRH